MITFLYLKAFCSDNAGNHTVEFKSLIRCLFLSVSLQAAPMDEAERNSLKRLYPDREQSSPPPSKQARREDPQRVLLYVRSGVEEVFDALMLSSPTVSGLQEAVSMN